VPRMAERSKAPGVLDEESDKSDKTSEYSECKEQV